jgi:hypothetical protein
MSITTLIQRIKSKIRGQESKFNLLKFKLILIKIINFILGSSKATRSPSICTLMNFFSHKTQAAELAHQEEEDRRFKRTINHQKKETESDGLI